jgi:hypothetical protein
VTVELGAGICPLARIVLQKSKKPRTIPLAGPQQCML